MIGITVYIYQEVCVLDGVRFRVNPTCLHCLCRSSDSLCAGPVVAPARVPVEHQFSMAKFFCDAISLKTTAFPGPT